MELLSPIIILGVPRSGTTLLRVLLGSHSAIHAVSETPWIAGAYGQNSLRDLIDYLLKDRTGPVAMMQEIDRHVIFRSGRLFVNEILSTVLTRTGRRRLLLKTPGDDLDFLVRLFPESQYVHIRRDPRDAACSTVARCGNLISNILDGYGELTIFTAIRRWCDWEETLCRRIESGCFRSLISIRYEDLVADPRTTLHRICEHLGMPFESTMLAYDQQNHVLPSWEAGSEDVRNRLDIDASSVGRWKREIRSVDMLRIDDEFGDRIEALGYKRCRDEVGFRLRRSALACDNFWYGVKLCWRVAWLVPRVPKKLALIAKMEAHRMLERAKSTMAR